MDYNNGAISEMCCKLELWYSSLVISVPLTCANYRVILLFTGSNQTFYLKGVQKKTVKLREMKKDSYPKTFSLSYFLLMEPPPMFPPKT